MASNKIKNVVMNVAYFEQSTIGVAVAIPTNSKIRSATEII
jgi:hypothetical protein